MIFLNKNYCFVGRSIECAFLRVKEILGEILGAKCVCEESSIKWNAKWNKKGSF